MDFAGFNFSKKEKRTIILAVTIGNLLEWYEIFLYVYWSPIIAKLFFNSESELVNLTNTFLVFAVGFLARPLGGLFFGRLGDLIGRKKSLILSIMMMIFPSFVTGFLPTHAQIGWYAPVLLGIMRFLQSFPAGGELPGGACYLYESSPLSKRRYMCSWGSLGFQLGMLIATVECFFLERYMEPEALINWGWRLSFIVGGLLGLFGLFLRSRLHETPLYKEMGTHEKIVKESILTVMKKNKRGMVKAILFCALNSAAFYLLTVNFPVYFGKLLGIKYSDNLIISMFLLVLITVPLPFFGMLGDKFNNKKILLGSTSGIIALLYPLYLSINHSSWVFMGIVFVFFSLLTTCLSALLPFMISELFPTRVRFTCVAVGFNLADAMIGGFTPAIVLFLLYLTGNQASFCWWLFICALLSFFAFLTMKEPKHSH